MSFTSELLPEPDTPVTHTNVPSGISTSMFLRLLCAAPMIFSQFLPGGRRLAGISIFSLPERYCPVRLRGSAAMSSAEPMATTSPPRTPGPGPKSMIVIGGPHRVFVVLDDDHGVAQIAQLRERGEQAVVVARVQADRRLVEDVQHADQAAADLSGQADALRFAAGKRGSGAVEREIIRARRWSGSRAGREFP